MISKEVTQIKRMRNREGGRKLSRLSFGNRLETCEVTTFRVLGLPIAKVTRLLSFSR